MNDTNPKGVLAKLYTSVTRKRGLWGTLVFLAKNPFYLYYKYQEASFDRKFNTETSHILSLQELDLPARVPATRDANYYQAIAVKSFTEMIEATPIDFRRSVFIDLGSGKGRALMLAARYPFAKIVGIELSPALHRIARDNINKYIQIVETGVKIELHCMDATAYDLPESNIVLFLYNPFVGTTMASIVDKLGDFLAVRPYELIIIYRNPKCADLFERKSAFELLKATPGYRIYAGSGKPKTDVSTNSG